MRLFTCVLILIFQQGLAQQKEVSITIDDVPNIHLYKKDGYIFITLDKALENQLYQSKEYYTGRYGFSWIYKWEKNEHKRKMLMQ